MSSGMTRISQVSLLTRSTKELAYLQAYKENNGREATEKEIYNWSLDHSTPEKIELFRLQALRSIEKYRQQEVKKAEPELRKAIEGEHFGSILSKVSSLVGPKAFWTSVGAGVVASFFWGPLAARPRCLSASRRHAQQRGLPRFSGSATAGGACSRQDGARLAWSSPQPLLPGNRGVLG